MEPSVMLSLLKQMQDNATKALQARMALITLAHLSPSKAVSHFNLREENTSLFPTMVTTVEEVVERSSKELNKIIRLQKQLDSMMSTLSMIDSTIQFDPMTIRNVELSYIHRQ